jgi:hypothetical protein
MDTLPVAMIMSQHAMNSTARSALPDAPVVPDSPRRARRTRPAGAPRAVRTRTRLSHVLDRAARAVAPTPSCIPAP